MKKFIPLSIFALLLPATIFAATNISEVIGVGTSILRNVIVFLIGLSMVYFFWGIAEFIGKSGDETARTEGKQRMLWGIIALFVTVSVWGLVGVISSSFKIDPGGTQPAPHL